MARFSSQTFYSIFFSLLALVIIFAVFKQAIYRFSADFVSPYLSLSAIAEDKISNTLSQLKSRQQLINENQLMNRELEALRGVQRNFENLKRDYDALRAIHQLPEIADFDYITAQVVLRDPATWNTRLTINRGSLNRIEEGSVVLALSVVKHHNKAPAYQWVVIGRITPEISQHSAVFQTLLDPSCSLSVYLPLAKTPAIICGGVEMNNQSLLSAKYIPLNKQLTEHEAVFTSGFSEYTPAGFFVGRVIKNASGNLLEPFDNIYATSTIELAADLQAIRYVIIPVRRQK